MLWPTISALGAGFALGLKHALDADHLAAVAAMVSERERSVAASSMVGLAWGAGHAASIVAVSLAMVLFGLSVPERLALWMEFAVGGILAVLGARVILRWRRGAVLHAHPHHHGGHVHFHPHVHPIEEAADHGSHHPLPRPIGSIAGGDGARSRTFLLGLAHGMAGSAALMILILATLQGRATQLAYVALFTAGSAMGMVLMSALVGLPFSRAGKQAVARQRALRLAAGGVSLALGLFMMWSLVPALAA